MVLRTNSPDAKFMIETKPNHSGLLFWRAAPAAAFGKGGFVAETAWSQWLPCAKARHHEAAHQHAVEQLAANG